MPRAVFVNGRSLQRTITGVERYTREVLARLGNRVQVLQGQGSMQGWRGHLWEQFELPRLIRDHNRLWSPANTGPLGVPDQVVTIHDVSIFDHPESFDPKIRIWYRLLLPRLARKAKKIITDSEFSRNRIVHWLGVHPEKVTTIHCGVDQSKFYPQSEANIARVRWRYSLPESYFLFVGSLDPRKNLSRLLQAWEMVGRDHTSLGLVIAGRSNRSFRRLELRNSPVGVRFAGYVEEDDLPALYSGAIGLVLPSLYEGFGLPILEAMACDTPGIYSRIPALEEVVQGAGLCFDPYNVVDLANTLIRLAADPAIQQDLIQKGRERVQVFSWEQTASKVWEVLDPHADG